MKTNTQLETIKKQLKDTGKVSRNWCLSQRITRLSARIKDLQNEGYTIDAEIVKTANGKDYLYTLRDRPKQRRIVIIDGRAIETYV